jgi:AcrR family transcriptional regulator
MSNQFTSGDGGERRSYHHGNLKEALIAAALQLISSKGPAGFTFAEAARQAGVSPAAPYRHYRDRDMLMADVAKRGFDLFSERLEEAWNKGRPNAFEAMQAQGRAYLAFARTEPAYYGAMFEKAIADKDYPECRAAADRAFQVLRAGCEAVLDEAKPARKPPVLMVALHVWSMSHGIASLFGRGDGASRSVPMSADDLLEANVLIYLDGLGIRKG